MYLDLLRVIADSLGLKIMRYWYLADTDCFIHIHMNLMLFRFSMT